VAERQDHRLAAEGLAADVEHRLDVAEPLVVVDLVGDDPRGGLVDDRARPEGQELHRHAAEALEVQAVVDGPRAAALQQAVVVVDEGVDRSP
jgi:hypothetical protein